MDICLVVPRFVLLVFIDVELPDDSGVINGQLLPELVLLPLLLLLGPFVFPGKLTSLPLNPGGWKEQILCPEH